MLPLKWNTDGLKSPNRVSLYRAKGKPDFANYVLLTVMFDKMKQPLLASDSSKHPSHSGNLQPETQKVPGPRNRESEKGVEDVGFERALTDWLMKHRANWRQNRHTRAELSSLSIL